MGTARAWNADDGDVYMYIMYGFIGSAPVSGTPDQAAWRKERLYILARMRGKPARKGKKWTRDEIHGRRKMYIRVLPFSPRSLRTPF